MSDVVELKVRGESAPNNIAGAMAAYLDEDKNVELHAVGAGAVNQAVKAIAIARGYMAPKGIDLKCIPAFTTANIEGEDRTAIKLIIVK